MRHDKLDTPPLQLRDKGRNALKRIIGVETLEAQCIGFVITLDGEPIAQCSDKISRTFLVTFAEEPDARRRRAIHRRSPQRNHNAAEHRKQIASLHGWMVSALQEAMTRVVVRSPTTLLALRCRKGASTPSLDDLVGAGEDHRCDRQAQGLCRYQIDK